jgi:prepilin-type processing-associated H-X9-DG protein
VLVLQNLGAMRLPIWHYAVLIGYDVERNVALLRSGRTERQEMRWQRFAKTWHRGGRFAFTTLVPGEIPAHAEASRYIEAAAGLEAAGEWRSAADAYDAAIARWPDMAKAWLGRGNVAYADGNQSGAADAYLRAILLAPEDAAARNNLAQLLADAGCPDEARRQVERATRLADDSALAPAVAGTRAAIESMGKSVTGCALGDRAWPD